LLKDIRREQLVAAVKGTAAGQAFLHPTVAGKVLSELARPASAAPQPPGGQAQRADETPGEGSAAAPADPLTARELDILQLIARGYSNPAIADQLHLAPGTVRNYVSNILQKLGVEDRTQAALTAYQRGLLRPP
jgi:DNA-binding NarL/FixJ family response regulator